MKLNAVNCGTAEIRGYAVDSYSCQINQPSKTLPSAITKQHHLRCLYTCQVRNFRYTTKPETKFCSDQSVTEDEESVMLQCFIHIVFYLYVILKNRLMQNRHKMSRLLPSTC